jgi:regulator of sigma E protease
MQILETVFYFVVTLGALVFVHELGHFLAAKLCRMRVERFSIGFPPRAFGKKFGETDYCISWIPIGGYVKIAGMIDESFDTDYLEKPPEQWEFRSKPIWQRMIVISAGVIMNIFLAIAIFWGLNYSKGKILRDTTEIGAVVEHSPAEQLGLKTGDRILSINNQAVSHWEDILNEIYIESMQSDVDVKLQRGSAEMNLMLPRAKIPDPTDTDFGIIPAHTVIMIDQVDPGKPAAELGLQSGDILVALDSIPVGYNQRVIEIVEAHKGKPLHIAWTRNGTQMEGTTVPNSEGRIGVSLGMRYTGPQQHLSYSLFGALPAGISDITWVTVHSFEQIWLMVTGGISITKNVGGPIKIAQFATQSAELGIATYLGFMAVLSISLAVLNILPFPALDGGHLFFLIYEAIFRREVPVKIKLSLQKAGFALLLAFMAFVLYNDIVNF